MDNLPSLCHWLDPRDEQKLDSLRAALEKRGIRPEAVDLANLPDREVLLLVFLSNALLESAGGRLEEVARAWKGPILPVGIEPLSTSPPSQITRFAPLRLGREDEDTVADLIALSAEQPTDRQLEWRDLAVRAAGASAPGLTKQLLSRRELEKAEDLIDALSGRVVVQAEVTQLLEKSRSALRRRRRRMIAVASIFTIVLTLAAALAFLQRQSAVASAERERAAAVRARADRFSRLSEQLLGSDPDLPAILAHRAYVLDPNEGTRESLRRALDFVPRHRSYHLKGELRSITGAPRSPFLALISRDGSASLVSAKNGRIVATVPQPRDRRGIPVAAVSDDGSAVALAYDDGLVQVRSLDPDFELLWSKALRAVSGSRSRSVAWMGKGVLLTTWDGSPPVRIDLDGGRTTTVRVPGFAAAVTAAASPGEKLIAVADSSHLAILRAGSLRPCLVRRHVRSPGGETLVFDLPAATLVAAREGSFPLQVPIPRRCGVRGAEKPESNA